MSPELCPEGSDALIVRTFMRAIYADGHVLGSEQLARFSALCVHTDVSIHAALLDVGRLGGQPIRGNLRVRDTHTESAYRVLLQGMNILADHVARGLVGACEAVDNGQLGPGKAKSWVTAVSKLVAPLAVADIGSCVVSQPTVLRVVSAVDVLYSRASRPTLAELGFNLDQRVLHRWLSIRAPQTTGVTPKPA